LKKNIFNKHLSIVTQFFSENFLKVNPGSNFLSGGKGNDGLYGSFDNDLMLDGKGAEPIECSGNLDIIIDFDFKDEDVQK
jgi:Ca2+-binding RTX toxin-like protein